MILDLRKICTEHCYLLMILDFGKNFVLIEHCYFISYCG